MFVVVMVHFIIRIVVIAGSYIIELLSAMVVITEGIMAFITVAITDQGGQITYIVKKAGVMKRIVVPILW